MTTNIINTKPIGIGCNNPIPKSWVDSNCLKREMQQFKKCFDPGFEGIPEGICLENDGTMKDETLNAKEFQEILGVDPFNRDDVQIIGETDNYGWKTYASWGAQEAFKNISEKYKGNIGYINFRLPSRSNYHAAQKPKKPTNLNTTDKMVGRLFVKKESREEFWKWVSLYKTIFPKQDEHEIHKMVYEKLGKECFLNINYVMTQNEFPYETHFESHLLVWVNPFTINREEVNVRILFKNVLNTLLNEVKTDEEKHEIKNTIYFLENMPVARSIKNIRHFHIFLNGIKNFNKWVDYYSNLS